MSLADELSQLTAQPKRRRCSVCTWINAQSPDVQTALHAARDRGVPSTELHAVAVRNGLNAVSRTFWQCLKDHHARG